MAGTDRHIATHNAVSQLLNKLCDEAGSNIAPNKRADKVVTIIELVPLLDSITKIRDLHASTQQSLNFYQLRCEALAEQQRLMRDPERKMVCDIIANGKTYTPPVVEDTTYTATGDLPLEDTPRPQVRTTSYALFISLCVLVTVALCYLTIGPPK